MKNVCVILSGEDEEMLRIAIVEDDENYRREFRTYLEQYGREHGEVFSIREFSDGDGILNPYTPDYDIILMDIEMAFVDGMTAAQEIRKSDTEVCIIFITNMPQYAIKGYTVGALDYILKPVSYYSFSETITRALGRRKTIQNKYVILNVKGGMRRISTSSIRYIEVMNHELIFHLVSEEITSRGALKEVEKELSGEYFFQCNKGFLINLAYVDGVVGNDVQIGEDRLQVSRARKKPLMDALNQYMAETGR
ncbi:LytR/AlgR family response regulator transcription factor [Bilifractor sp. LCP19S3_H10]|uniref:LytR/AlgR family response regulator transcription factor n=1 Tax=Bilifractor sp. LCP19S3_H10 TaxID=3438736 RepID=UPI003F90FF68